MKVKILVLLVSIFAFLIIRPIRTIGIMEDIARDELMNELADEFGDHDYEVVLNKIKGPEIIENKQEQYVQFIWHTKIANGNTAYIYIDVFRNPFAKWYFSPRVTMNNQWQLVTAN